MVWDRDLDREDKRSRRYFEPDLAVKFEAMRSSCLAFTVEVSL